MQIPAQSLDLNVIENVWNELEKYVRKHTLQTKNNCREF